MPILKVSVASNQLIDGDHGCSQPVVRYTASSGTEASRDRQAERRHTAARSRQLPRGSESWLQGDSRGTGAQEEEEIDACDGRFEVRIPVAGDTNPRPSCF